MKKINVAIIGQGRSGRAIHAKSFVEYVPELYTVVAVCDAIPGRCEPSRKETGCETYTDYKKMLKQKDIDLVINASFSHEHVPITHEVLDAGLDIITDKPLARHARDVDALIAKAKKKKRFFTVFQQSRFAPYFTTVKDVIDSGVLGRIVQIKIAFNGFGRRWDWQTIQDMNAGNLLNTGPHPLDQALQLFGDADPEVFCRMDKAVSFGDAEDHVKLILHKQGHPTIDLEVSSCCAYSPYTYQVYGTQGGLSGTMTHLDWKYFKPEEAPPQVLIRTPMPDLGYCAEKLTWHEEKWDVPAEDADLFKAICSRYYRHIHDVLVDGETLQVTPAQVRRQIAVIEEAHRQNPLPKMPA
jgi:predicted dehydrogenase